MTSRIVRNRILASAALALILAPAGVPAHAASKDIIQLQTQVQQLLDMVQRLQSTVDTKFAVMQNLAQQTADEANQMTAAVSNLQKQVDAQAQAVNGKTDAISGQVQSLNDSVDELKTRIDKVDKSIQDLQTQLQQLQSQPNPAAMPGALPGSVPGSAPGAMPGTTPGAAPTGAPAEGAAPGTPQSGAQQPGTSSTMPGAAAGAQAPPLEDTYQAGMRDFNAGRYSLAASEFQDVVHYYPMDDLAGSAQFYLGEIAYQQKNYNDAVNDYNAVIEGFAGNAKAPAAQLHKAYALLDLNKRSEGIRELRLLIQRHPQTPEARAARTRLNGMGVRVTASTAH